MCSAVNRLKMATKFNAAVAAIAVLAVVQTVVVPVVAIDELETISLITNIDASRRHSGLTTDDGVNDDDNAFGTAASNNIFTGVSTISRPSDPITSMCCEPELIVDQDTGGNIFACEPLTVLQNCSHYSSPGSIYI